MRNSNANNTILFIEKKKEFENNRDNHNSKDNKIVIKDKNAKIISLSTYKRLKFKRHHIINKGEKHLNIDKVKKRVFLIVILALFLLIFATTVMRQRSYSSVPSNTFIAQNTKINTTESLTYKSIVTKVVNKYTNSSYKVYVSNLHQNGNLVYAQGYFDVPKEGNVHYDLILKNDSPTSLIINGNEYVK